MRLDPLKICIDTRVYTENIDVTFPQVFETSCHHSNVLRINKFYEYHNTDPFS